MKPLKILDNISKAGDQLARNIMEFSLSGTSNYCVLLIALYLLANSST